MPEFERVYAVNTFMIYEIDNIQKITPVLTSSAPIATGHCTFVEIDVSTK